MLDCTSDKCLEQSLIHVKPTIVNRKSNENAWALMRPPAMYPLCQYSCPKVVKGCQDVMLWHHVTSWRAVTLHIIRYHDKMALCNLHSSHNKKSRKIMFFSKWRLWPLTYDLDLQTCPWPLTYDLDLQTCPRYSMFLPNFRSVAQTVQTWEHWQTDTQTGPIPYRYPRPLTRQGKIFATLDYLYVCINSVESDSCLIKTDCYC